MASQVTIDIRISFKKEKGRGQECKCCGDTIWLHAFRLQMKSNTLKVTMCEEVFFCESCAYAVGWEIENE